MMRKTDGKFFGGNRIEWKELVSLSYHTKYPGKASTCRFNKKNSSNGIFTITLFVRAIKCAILHHGEPTNTTPHHNQKRNSIKRVFKDPNRSVIAEIPFISG